MFNSIESALDEAMNGVLTADPGRCERLETEYGYGIYRSNLKENCVRVILNGGGGIGPMWAGCVAEGLSDGIVHGEFDSAPNAYTIYEMAKKLDAGKGVLLITNNYMGDYLNNDMACELLAYDGIESEVCLISDDAGSARGRSRSERGGMSGILQVAKAAVKAAYEGKSLKEVKAVADRFNENTVSVTALYDDDGNISYGAGFSGEPPLVTEEFTGADDFVKHGLEILLDDFEDIPEKIFLNISRMRNTCYAESMVILQSSVRFLEEKGIKVCGCTAGSYFDVFEQGGCIFTVTAVDEDMEAYTGRVSGYDFTV